MRNEYKKAFGNTGVKERDAGKYMSKQVNKVRISET